MSVNRRPPFEGAKAREMMIGHAIIVVPLATLFALGAIFLKREPMSRQHVIGCYTAVSAPTLQIHYQKILFGENRLASMNYVIETSKEGYHLLVTPSMILNRGSDGRYAFSSGRGIGYFWNLLAKDGSPRLRVPNDYNGQLETIATDGSSVVYSRTNDRAKCAP